MIFAIYLVIGLVYGLFTLFRNMREGVWFPIFGTGETVLYENMPLALKIISFILDIFAWPLSVIGDIGMQVYVRFFWK